MTQWVAFLWMDRWFCFVNLFRNSDYEITAIKHFSSIQRWKMENGSGKLTSAFPLAFLIIATRTCMHALCLGITGVSLLSVFCFVFCFICINSRVILVIKNFMTDPILWYYIIINTLFSSLDTTVPCCPFNPPPMIGFIYLLSYCQFQSAIFIQVSIFRHENLYKPITYQI